MTKRGNVAEILGLREAKRYLEALLMSDEVLSRDGDSGPLRMERARVYACLQEHSKAVEEATLAIALEPEELAHYLDRARWSMRLSRFEAASADLSVIIEARGRMSDYYRSVALLYRAQCALHLCHGEQAIADARASGIETTFGGAGGLIDPREVIQKATSLLERERARRR